MSEAGPEKPDRDQGTGDQPCRPAPFRLRALRPPIKPALIAGLLSCAGVLTWQMQQGHTRIPDRWNPWADLRVAEAPNWLTRFKLMRLSNDATTCRRVLRGTELDYDLLPDRETGPGCGLRNAVRIRATAMKVKAPFSLSCPAAVALAIWERHSVRPTARSLLDSEAVRLLHFGSYACRDVYGRDRRSSHATADALDVAGFGLADGRQVRLAQHWGADSAKGRFLRQIRQDACEVFGTVLGPDYNRAHRDHLHLQSGTFGLCR